MLYHLLSPLAERFIAFNLFNYISFRAAGAAVTAMVLAFLVGPAVIRRLKDRNVGQVIRAEGPASHQAKRGTPTMGGLIILIATLVPTVLWARLDNRYVVVAAIATLWLGTIGFVDDYLKFVSGKSRGLVARHKLIGQVTFGVLLGTYLLLYPLADNLPANATTLPFFKYVLLPLPPLLYDGLAIGLSAVAAVAFAIFAYLFGRIDTAEYLWVYYLPGAGELTIFCAALLGAALGFLWFNAHPAQVFMGDTGSLAIGGAFGTVAILMKSEFLLLLVGGVFVAEAVSVILQTGAYKWHKQRRGREYADQHRVFRMAPLHHHFEKLGWPESKVVMRFYIIGILCALFALSTLKIR